MNTSIQNQFILDYQTMSKERLSIKYGISYDALRKKARKLNICRPKNLWSPIGAPCKKRNWEDLYKEYLSGKSIEEISKLTNISPTTLTKNFKKNNLKIRNLNGKSGYRKYTLNEEYFETINTEDKAYFLGFIMADGCVYLNKQNCLSIQIHKNDVEVLEKFKKCLNSTSPIYNMKGKKENMVSFKLYSEKLLNDLIKLGVTERKSLTLKFPNLEQVPEELLSHFIRGYFDGDGTVTCCSKIERNVSVGFCLSYDFVKGFKKTIENLFGFQPVSYYCKNKIVELRYSGRGNVIKWFNFLYKEATIFLKRKRDRFIEIINKKYNFIINSENRNIYFQKANKNWEVSVINNKIKTKIGIFPTYEQALMARNNFFFKNLLREDSLLPYIMFF